MSGKLRLKLIVHCFLFAAEAKRRHLSPCCFSSDDYQMIYPIIYPVLFIRFYLSGFIIRFIIQSCRAALLPMQQSHEVILPSEFIHPPADFTPLMITLQKYTFF